MKIAVIYNEAYPYISDQYQTELPKDLGFKPYFDFVEHDPIAEFESIAENLRKVGFDAYILNILDNLDIFFEDYERNRPDAVFNLVEIFKDIPRLEMNFTGLLDLMKIPYTGAGPIALGTCQNKTLTKRILHSLGINTPNFKYIKSISDTYKHGLNFPIIVKPAHEDASVGIENDSIVYTQTELRKRVEHVFDEYHQPALIEEFIDGRELNVAVLGDTKPKVLPISEIDFTKMPDHLHNIVSFQAKWEPMHEAYHKTIPKCPAPLSKKITKEAGEIAMRAFKAVSCRDYCRVDMRLSKDKKLYVLEVNPNPDLTEDAGFMRSAKVGGYSYRQTLKTIVEFALKRKL